MVATFIPSIHSTPGPHLWTLIRRRCSRANEGRTPGDLVWPAAVELAASYLSGEIPESWKKWLGGTGRKGVCSSVSLGTPLLQIEAPPAVGSVEYDALKVQLIH